MNSKYIKKVRDILNNEGIFGLVAKTFEFFSYRLQNVIKHFKMLVYTSVNDKKNKLYYHAPPNPYGTISVDASEISQIISDRNHSPIAVPHNGGFAQIRSGSWPSEENLTEFDSYYVKRSFKQRFQYREAWESTAYYERLTKKGISEEKIKEKLENYDYLYKSMKKRGYKKDLFEPSYKGTSGYRAKLEPFVIIDESGEIYLWDGRHRFCIAQMLGLEIPVHVLCRHKRWQKTRDDIYKNGLSEGYDDCLQNHPDLQDVVN